MATRTAGAVCTTTCFSGSARASQTLGGVVPLVDGADRTDVDALPAEDAGHVGQILAAGRGDHGLETPVDREERPDALDVLADRHAAPAEDALVRVADDGRGGSVLGVLDPVL